MNLKSALMTSILVHGVGFGVFSFTDEQIVVYQQNETTLTAVRIVPNEKEGQRNKHDWGTMLLAQEREFGRETIPIPCDYRYFPNYKS